ASLGDTIFMTGNKYAAVSTNNGATFTFINPFTFFPTTGAFAGSFCCDQRAVSDSRSGLIFWVLMYYKTVSGPSDTNGLRLAVARGADDLTNRSSWSYHDITAADFGLGSGRWLDYPQIQLSANTLYLSANAYSTSDDTFTDAVIGRFPLQ